MEMGFWGKLNTPILCLAPMDDVTDAAFRYIIAKHSKEHGPQYMTFTEFTSADGLVLADEKGQQRLRAKLRFDEIERPIVAQLFTAVPERMEEAASLVQRLGFDGVDINMGCPDRTVEKTGCGSALIKNPELATELIAAAQRGASNLPVSVKTRIGYSESEVESWVPHLLSANIAALTIHARTRNEMSKVPARWEHVREAVAIRDELGAQTKIIGNGDVQDLQDAYAKIEETGCDGAMLGRAMFGNPWVMSEYVPSVEEKLQALKEHTELFEKHFDGIKSFAIMRKHFASYVTGFDDAKELRVELMSADTAQEVRDIIQAHEND